MRHRAEAKDGQEADRDSRGGPRAHAKGGGPGREAGLQVGLLMPKRAQASSLISNVLQSCVQNQDARDTFGHGQHAKDEARVRPHEEQHDAQGAG